MFVYTPPLVKEWLRERFAVLPYVTQQTDMQVSWGNPFPAKLADVLLVFDDTKEHAREHVAALTQANDTYAITGYISVAKHFKTDRKKLWELAGNLASAVDSELLRMTREGDLPSGEGWQVHKLLYLPSHDADALPQDGADSREVSIMFDIAVLARLSDA